MTYYFNYFKINNNFKPPIYFLFKIVHFLVFAVKFQKIYLNNNIIVIHAQSF